MSVFFCIVMCVSVCILLLCLDAQLCSDLAVLFTCLRDIRAAMQGEAAYCFEQDLYYSADPLELATRNVALILNDTRFLWSLFVNTSSGGGGGGGSFTF